MKNKKRTSVVEARVKPAVAPLPTPSRGWLRFAPLLIVAAVLVVYARALSLDFIYFDDVGIIKQRYFIIGDISKIATAFTTDAFLAQNGVFYRPLQTVSFMIDALVGGPGPFIYHLSNVLLHGAATLCLFWLMLTLNVDRLIALFLSLLFGVHPMFVPMGAWVPTRGDLLLSIFVILSFIAFIKSVKSGDLRLVALHGLTMLLALFSKETAVAIPGLCLAYYWLELRKYPIKKLFPWFVLLWALSGGAWHYFRSMVRSGNLPVENLGLVPVLKNFRMLPELLGKFFLPFDFQLVPLFDTTDLVIGLVTIVVFAWLVLRVAGASNGRVRFGLFWFFLCIGPVLVFRNSDADFCFNYLYHRFYLPGAGLMIVIAELARVALRGRFLPQWVQFGAGAVLLYCGALSFREIGFYADPGTFYTEAIARTPRNALCFNNFGVYQGNELRDNRSSVKAFDKAIELYPEYLTAIANRGRTSYALGRHEQAMADLQTVVKASPNDENTVCLLADLRYLLNDYAGALKDYDRILSMNVLYPRIHAKRAGCMAMLGDAVGALEEAGKAVRVDAKDEEAYNNRGLANRLLGRMAEAIADFDKAVEIKENYSRPYNNRGTVFLALGQPEKALADFEKAVTYDKDFADAYSNLGAVKKQLGRNEEALSDLNKALSIVPHHVDALQNRGVVKNMLKQFPEALDDFNRCIQLDSNKPGPYLGRGISRHYIGDQAGACEDWRRAASLASKEAADLVGQFCKE